MFDQSGNPIGIPENHSDQGVLTCVTLSDIELGCLIQNEGFQGSWSANLSWDGVETISATGKHNNQTITSEGVYDGDKSIKWKPLDKHSAEWIKQNVS